MPVRTEVAMGTLVTIQVESDGADAALGSAFDWFRSIETTCTRFDEHSELRRLQAQVGTPVSVSATLFEVVRFAVTVAAETGGAFDPVISGDNTSYLDLEVNSAKQSITLRRPLQLDLGAVAKGLAVDAAARELAPHVNFAIDAGGDLYMGGCNPEGQAWKVGIRHPRSEGELIASRRLSNQAICTSGDYERGRHILDPRTGVAAGGVASASVVAPSAMLADALATAAFVLGPADGISLLERLGLAGLIVTPSLEQFQTTGWAMNE